MQYHLEETIRTSIDRSEVLYRACSTSAGRSDNLPACSLYVSRSQSFHNTDDTCIISTQAHTSKRYQPHSTEKAALSIGCSGQYRLDLRVYHHCNRSEEHTSELQSRPHLVCRLLLEKKKKRRRLEMTFVNLSWGSR